MLAYTTAQGERRMERLMAADHDESIGIGRAKLAANEMDASDAALVFESVFGEKEIPAVIIEMRAYCSPQSVAVAGIRFTPKESGKFSVRNPDLLCWKNCEDFDKKACYDAFFAGVEEHEKGSAVWRAAWIPEA